MGPNRSTVRLGCTVGAGFGLTEALGLGLARNVAEGEGSVVAMDVCVGVNVAVAEGVESPGTELAA